MTDVVPTKPVSLAIGSSGLEGLEDVDAGDILTPIIKIDHDDHVFVSSLDNRRFATFKSIPLGLIKQRILWPADPGAPGDLPLCRSYDHDSGHPDQERFYSITRKLSGFSVERIEAAEEDPLPCADCSLTEWDSHPKSGSSWCAEQYTIPMLVVEEDSDGDEQLMPAMMSFQRTALKPVKAFLSSFIGRKRPLFTHYTTLSLKTLTGKGEYDVPKFDVGDETDPAKWSEFAAYFYNVRELIKTPRTRREEDVPVTVKPSASTVTVGEVIEDTGAGGTKRPTPVATKAAAPVAAPIDPVYDDDEPFLAHVDIGFDIGGGYRNMVI